eukprot:scpid90718/ scgid11924/ 
MLGRLGGQPIGLLGGQPIGRLGGQPGLIGNRGDLASCTEMSRCPSLSSSTSFRSEKSCSAVASWSRSLLCDKPRHAQANRRGKNISRSRIFGSCVQLLQMLLALAVPCTKVETYQFASRCRNGRQLWSDDAERRGWREKIRPRAS